MYHRFTIYQTRKLLVWCYILKDIKHIFCALTWFNGLSHLADLARRSYTGAHIWRFSGIGTSTVAQRYHIAKNGSTSSEHRQNISEQFSNGAPTLEIFEYAIQRYGFVNVGRTPVAPRN
jgi:hypothetical protein